MPRRIQLSRQKGWRKPEGAVVVSRPSGWGNPFRIGDPFRFHDGDRMLMGVVGNREMAVDLFGRYMAVDSLAGEMRRDLVRDELASYDLACWCPLDQPCHADVLLELANA
jgi:hypothetical protein